MIEFDLELLAELPAYDQERFAADKKRYQNGLLEPAKAFVADLEPLLHEEVSAGLVAQPKVNGSISPINNDLRFSPDKSPYRDYLLFNFWEGRNKKTAPTLRIRIHPDGVGFATGIVFADLDAWRDAVDRDGAQLAAALANLEKTKGADVVGQGLKRIPKPYPDDHPQGELLKHKMLQAHWQEPWPKQGLERFCSKRLRLCLPVHEWLLEHLT